MFDAAKIDEEDNLFHSRTLQFLDFGGNVVGSTEQGHIFIHSVVVKGHTLGESSPVFLVFIW